MSDKECLHSLTFQVGARDVLEHLIDEDDGERELQHHDPLIQSQMSQLENHL